MSRLCELLAECLPVDGITALTEPVKRGLLEALLHRPNDVTQQFGEKCEFLGLQPMHFPSYSLTCKKQVFYADRMVLVPCLCKMQNKVGRVLSYSYCEQGCW